MMRVIKGIIFGKQISPDKEIEGPPANPRLLATNPTQEPNHQREILRREAQIAKTNH